MSALFLNPKSFTVIEGNALATAPVRRANNDHRGAVWRSNGLSGVYAILQLDGSAFDTIALLSNLRSVASIRVRTAGSAAATSSNPIADMTVTAWSGTAPAQGYAVSTVLLPTPTTGPFVRIDLTDAANPAGYIEVQRVLVGKRIEHGGVVLASEQAVIDGSEIEDGRGFSTVDRYNGRTQWKSGVDNIKHADYGATWFPFLADVRKSKAWLFIPDTGSAQLQNEAILGRFTQPPVAVPKSSDFYVLEFTVLQI